MLIGICGSICAGKHTTAEYLIQQHNFLRLHLPTPTQLQPQSSPAQSNGLSHSSTSPPSHSQTEKLDHLRLLPSVTDQAGTRGLSFPDVDSLLDFVTKRWREHWVLTDIYDEATLELLLRRPFFLLINVDAPVGVRFERFSERYGSPFHFRLSVLNPCLFWKGRACLKLRCFDSIPCRQDGGRRVREMSGISFA